VAVLIDGNHAGPQRSRGTFHAVRRGVELNVQLIALVGGLVTAALAIASQKVVTSFVSYLLIRRKRIFHVGDRIKLGRLRGDVLSIGFLHTRLLEFGQPEGEQEDPGMWVRARQFSGRILTVTNDKVFDEAVYNYSREFPYLWDEIRLPVRYTDDHARAEHILLDAAIDATAAYSEQARAAIQAFNERYRVAMDDPAPTVYWRLTDNWLELTIRFVVPERGGREVKDRMARQILRALAAAHIDVASTTLEISGIAPIEIRRVATKRS
jgi:small-conductance mechanosensitive channel